MRADTVRFVHECRMLDYEALISRIAGLYEQFCELQVIIKTNTETQAQMSRDYQSVVSKLEQVQLENTSLNRQLAHLAEQNLLKTREVFGSSCENLSKITQNSYDSVPDIDGHGQEFPG